MNLMRRLLFSQIHQNWNIALADVGEDFRPVNVRWMRHGYTDRWFADPFIVGETLDEYVILVEEYLRDTGRGRIARLTIDKNDCVLHRNECLLDIDTHLSYPNYMEMDGQTYIYPENAASGNLSYYLYGESLRRIGTIATERLADATILRLQGGYYLLATVDERCNGNVISVYFSKSAFGGYELRQTIEFPENIARRAGNIFSRDGRLYSPAQVCNRAYGEALSIQELSLKANGDIILHEVKRLTPPSDEYVNGFHTYNVWNGDKLVIDGYRYGSPVLSRIYRRLRGIKE